MFTDINISQGSVVMPLRCGGLCSDLFIANILLTVTVKEFKKMIFGDDMNKSLGLTFWPTLYIASDISKGSDYTAGCVTVVR